MLIKMNSYFFMGYNMKQIIVNLLMFLMVIIGFYKLHSMQAMQGAILPSATDDQRTILRALEEDDVELVEAFLVRKVSPKILNAEGNTLLHIAACKGHVSLFEKLVGAGIDPTIQNKSLNERNQRDMIKLLLENGALPHIAALPSQPAASQKSVGVIDVLSGTMDVLHVVRLFTGR